MWLQKEMKSTGTGFALLPGVGHRLPDRDALNGWLIGLFRDGDK